MKKYGLIIILFGVSILLVYFFSSNQDYVKVGKIYINEIVASNSYTFKNNDGEYDDYIELYNGNNYDVNLQGYRLTDSIVDSKKWTFPDITIKKNDYLIIYASGKNKCDEECHTNYKLNKDGETISLIDDTGNIISRVTYPKLSPDTSYSFVKNKYMVTMPSPGKENNSDVLENIDVKKYSIKINEYMTHNKGASYARNGGYYDFVELFNDSDEDINIKGLSLSDNQDDLNKFILPEKVIKAHDYLVIYLTGGEEVKGEIYANFKLSDNDEKIIISANGEIIDEVEIVILDKNMSYGKKDDKWLYFLSPTPGYANTTYGIDKPLNSKEGGE